MLINTFYMIKVFIPRKLQIFLRKKMIERKLPAYTDIWPIDENAGKAPENWSGWPSNKKFALILTHDVDTIIGQEKCEQLMELEKSLGFRSSFNFVPERYPVSEALRILLKTNGFEVGVHGLNHDGKLFRSKDFFFKRASRINRYLKDWQSVGFRAPAMHHHLDWIHKLNILYDASTFDTDPFEPQPDGVGTIFPFWVSNNNNAGYIELPYTLPQDFTLFILMKESNNNIWEKKLDWISKKGGMALLLTHPDYMCFEKNDNCTNTYPVERYKDFLNYVKKTHKGQYWQALPEEIAKFTQKQIVS